MSKFTEWQEQKEYNQNSPEEERLYTKNEKVSRCEKNIKPNFKVKIISNLNHVKNVHYQTNQIILILQMDQLHLHIGIICP